MTAAPRTIPDLIYAAFDRWPKPDALKFKKDGAWRDIPTAEFERRIAALAHAFAAGRLGALTDGLQPGDRVALISENRPEWTITDLACQTLGLALVPIYPSLPADQVGYILQNSGAKVAIASNAKHLAKVAAAGPACPELRRVVVMDAGAPSGLPLPRTVSHIRNYCASGESATEVPTRADSRDSPSASARSCRAAASRCFTASRTAVCVRWQRRAISAVRSRECAFPHRRWSLCLFEGRPRGPSEGAFGRGVNVRA